MNILDQIKQALNNFKNRFFNGNQKIEAPREKNKGTSHKEIVTANVDEEVKDISFQLDWIKEKRETLDNGSLAAVPDFKALDDATIKGLMEQQIGTDLIGWNYKKEPTVSGTIDGKNFVGVEPKQHTGTFSLAICTDNGRYDLTRDLKGQYGQYEVNEDRNDGTHKYFYGRLDIPDAISSISKDGITLRERIHASRFFGESEFERYAQPSAELLEEYSQVTGLPVISTGYGKGLSDSGVFGGTKDKPVDPCYVTITAEKEEKMDNTEGIDLPQITKKEIKYVFSSLESYLNGEKPYMIYMGGIDGRNGASGMFRRLEGDTYVDNSTFTREENGEYSIQTISYDEIMALAGKMRTQVSDERINSVAAGKFKIPVGIEAIYNQAKSYSLGNDQAVKDGESK